MNTPITMYTHDGGAHADDAFAAAVLRIIYPDAKIVRTRDVSIIKSEAGKQDTFFLDLGGRYDASQRLFDHHQPAGAGYRIPAESLWPYATAGLVWKHYGAEAVKVLHPTLNDQSITEIVTYIDDSLLKYIDAVDCGVRIKSAGPSVSALIASFNTSWYEQDSDVFSLVLALTQEILTNFIKRYAGKILAREKVRAAHTVLDGQVLVLDVCLPWVELVSNEMPQVMFVAYPVGDDQRQWQIRAAVNPDKSTRIKLPESWGGHERSSLAAITGEPTAIFCHRSRHLAGASTLNGALALAEQAILSVTNEAVLNVA